MANIDTPRNTPPDVPRAVSGHATHASSRISNDRNRAARVAIVGDR